jgi:hypothetical protein
LNIGRGFADEKAQVMLGDQVEHEPMLDDLYIFLLAYRIQQGAFYLLTGDILMMKDTELGMTAFLAQLEIPFGILVKPGAPFDDLPDAFGTFLYNDLHRTRITKPVARDQRILDMLVIAVVLQVGHAGDAALRIFGIRLIDLCLGDDKDLLVGMMLRYFQGIAQPRYAGTNYKEISFYHNVVNRTSSGLAKLAPVDHLIANKKMISFAIIPLII